MSQPSPPSAGPLYEIRWKEICPWLILVKALRVTLFVRVLLLAALGGWLTLWGDQLIDTWNTPTQAPYQRTNLDVDSYVWHRPLAIVGVPTQDYSIDYYSTTLLRGWQWYLGPLQQLADRDVSSQSALFICLHGFWGILVWSLVGGAIARIAAIYLTRGEVPSLSESLRDALAGWTSMVGAPLIVLVAALVMGIPFILLGLLLRIDLMASVLAVVWILIPIWGLMLAVVLVGLLLGWPLMAACLGVERSDAFDSVSRAYAYVFQRPIHLAFYLLVAAFLCALGSLVVSHFSAAAIIFTEWFLSIGAGSDRLSELLGSQAKLPTNPLATQAINTWYDVWQAIAAFYPLACVWPMSVGIYLLFRRQVDATEMDEIDS